MTRACRTSGGSTTPTPARGRIACDLVTFVPPGDPRGAAGRPRWDPWAGLREELAADVRRVSDRLRSLSATRLASPPGPSAGRGAAVRSPGPQAGRAAAAELARAAARPRGWRRARPDLGRPPDPRRVPDLPVLADLAVGDQVAVTGHDLLAALDAVGPDALVRSERVRAPDRRAGRAGGRPAS